MPGFIVTLGAQVMCAHGGQAVPTVPDPRVTIMGQPVATLAAPWAIAGCPFVPPAPGPCVTAQWVVGSTRVLVDGQPVVLQLGTAVCVPTGTPLVVLVTQPRVSAL